MSIYSLPVNIFNIVDNTGFATLISSIVCNAAYKLSKENYHKIYAWEIGKINEQCRS